jgi:broad-specificity NMP kinase
MQKDGRTNIQASLERLGMYKLMDTVKVDTTNREVGEIVDEILAIIDQDIKLTHCSSQGIRHNKGSLTEKGGGR